MSREAVLLVDEALLVLFVEAADCWLRHPIRVLLNWIFQIISAPAELRWVVIWSTHETEFAATVAPRFLTGVAAFLSLFADILCEFLYHLL